VGRRVQVPLDGGLQPLPLALAHVGEHGGLVRQRGDELGTGHLVHRPGSGGRHLGQVLDVAGLVPSGLGGREVVLHAHQLEVLDPAGHVEGAVGQVPLGPGRHGGELGLVQEVERRGGRRLEVEALHGADAAVGPVRQEHEGHGRAVADELRLVLPHGPTAALLGPHGLHRLDEVPVLVVAAAVGGRLPALVAGEVPAGPAVDEVVLAGGEAHPVVLVGAVGVAERQGAQLHADPRQRQQHGGHRHHPQHRAPGLGAVRGEAGGQRPGDLDHAEGSQEVGAQVVEGQEAGVPQPALGQEDERHPGQHRHDRQEEVGALAAGDAPGHADEGQQPGHPVVPRPERIAHPGPPVGGPQAVVGPRLDLLPAHVVHVRPPPHERQGPEGAEQAGDRCHRQDPPQRGAAGVETDHHDRADDREQRGDQVTEPDQGEEHGGHGSVLAGLQAAGDDPQVDQRQGEADGEGELARHRRGDVAAVDREAAVEEEEDRGRGQHRRAREPQPGQLAEGPGRRRHEHDPADHDQLEGHRIRQDDVQGEDRQERHHHVEVEGGGPGVPVGRPAAEPPVGQEVVPQVGARPDVGAHVAAGGGGVAEDELGVQLGEGEGHRPQHDRERDPALQGRRHDPGAQSGQAGTHGTPILAGADGVEAADADRLWRGPRAEGVTDAPCWR